MAPGGCFTAYNFGSVILQETTWNSSLVPGRSLTGSGSTTLGVQPWECHIARQIFTYGTVAQANSVEDPSHTGRTTRWDPQVPCDVDLTSRHQDREVFERVQSLHLTFFVQSVRC